MKDYVEAVYAGRITIEPLSWDWIGMAVLGVLLLWLLVDAIRARSRVGSTTRYDRRRLP